MAERSSFAAIAVALTACYAPSAPRGAPCGVDSDCPSSQVCDPEALTCGPPAEARTLRDDTAADFGAEGAYTAEVTLEAAGFVGPVAHLPGGVRLTGIDAHVIGDPLTPWNELAAAARSGSSLARGLDLDFGEATPPGLGLSGGNNVTILVEGELMLDTAGAWRFELTANDLGFFEIAPPGSDAFTRVVTDGNDATIGNYDVAAPGWHRFRGAFADATSNMSYEVRYDRPGPGGLRAIPDADLRAPAGDLGGVLVDGFDDAFLIGPAASVVHAGTLGGLQLGADPFGLPIGQGSYSMRFAAQVLIEVEGSYALRIDSGQGHRAWIDGASVASAFTAAPAVTVTPAVRLDPGWHDLVIDVHRTDGGPAARLDVTVAEGPAWAGAPIPPENLRPVVGRGARWAAARALAALAIPDGGAATRTLTLDVPQGMAASRVDVAFEVDHAALSTVEIVLDPPAGANVTLTALGTLGGSGVRYQHAIAPTSSGATWGFLVSDSTADMMIGDLTYAAVTMIGAGGPAPFPAGYRYVSAPRELGDVPAIAHVRWALRQPRPDTSARVSLRTCDEPAACEAEAWTEVADGAKPAVPARRFAQYMVEVAGVGDAPTALDWLEIGYRAYVSD